MAAADAYVHVGCKMPNGVVLHLRQTEVDRTGGFVVVTTKGEDLGEVTLRGTAVPVGQVPLDIDGYVFTKVEKSFWDHWMSLNSRSSLLADGFIKAVNTEGQTRGMAREHEDVPAMFERIVTDGRDPKDRNRSSAERASRGTNPDIKKFDANDDGRAAA